MLYETSVVPTRRLSGDVEKEIGVRMVSEFVIEDCNDSDSIVDVAKSGESVGEVVTMVRKSIASVNAIVFEG
jgi:hypothetical protein